VRKYCKAYKLHDLRQFSGWTEKPVEDGQPLSDDDIGYLWDDFTVARSPIHPDSVLFDTVTPEWRDFCATVLGFAIPEDLRYAYEPESGEEHSTTPQTAAKAEATAGETEERSS
jgi:hypothetical protein